MISPRIVVLIPCYNEALTIGKVIADFRVALPQAAIYVYDNNSADGTREVALAAGAIVRSEQAQGKGNVVRRMFRDVEADFYIMVDGDDTYEASLSPDMLSLAMSGPFDLVNCIRRETEDAAYRGGHRLGNRLLTGVVRSIFGNRVLDMLSGYKVFSRRFVKSFPALSTGFDIETELTVHALELSMPVTHVHGSYRGRPEGSESKLRTYRDGWRILMMILKLVRHERPMVFFGILGCIVYIGGIGLNRASDCNLSQHRPCAQAAYRSAVDGHHAAGIPELDYGHDSGYRDTRTSRTSFANLFAIPGATL